MKPLKTILAIAVVFSIAACRDNPIQSYYQPVLPELPIHWKDIPGDPHWRIQWIGENGNWEEDIVPPGKALPRLNLVQEWATPLISWPFWPELNLLPGMMRPCGALFPWDSYGDKLMLGWEGGVIACFWKELATSDRPTPASAGRIPWYFDWPRFRELLSSDNIPVPVRHDLWLPDWKNIAEKTVQSGFDRRRIVSRIFTEISVPGFGGRWIGSSPFAPVIEADNEDSLNIKVSGNTDTWISAEGILKCSSSGWIFIAYQ